MGFKIKKSILAGTSGHRKAVTDRGASLIKINKSIDKSSRDDGRAKSSAFQLTKDEIKWQKEKKTSTNVTETPTSTDTTTNYRTDGVQKGQEVESFLDENDPEAVAAWLAADPKNKAKYRDKDVSKERSETSTVPKETPTPTPEPTPKKDPPKKEKDCHCKGQPQYSPGGQGTSTSYRSWEKYFCGYEGDGTSESDYQKHPNCLTQNKQQKIDGAEKNAVYAGGLGLDQGSFSNEKRKALGINFEGKYLGEGGGAEGNVGYSESTLERKNRRTEHRKELKELENSMGKWEWKRYKKKHKGNLLQK